MKKLLSFITVAVMTLAFAVPAQAQFKIGPRIGMNVNKLNFDKEVFDGANRAGFTAGLEAEFTVPVVGIGLDASVMYVRRNSRFMSEVTGTDWPQQTKVSNGHSDYIDVPVYVKWKFGLPIVGGLVKPFLFTGPDFAFLCSKKAITDAWKSKKVDTSWNFGLGVEFFNHLQFAASYGLGMSKAAEFVGATEQGTKIEGKNRYWTVTAAYLF